RVIQMPALQSSAEVVPYTCSKSLKHMDDMNCRVRYVEKGPEHLRSIVQTVTGEMGQRLGAAGFDRRLPDRRPHLVVHTEPPCLRENLQRSPILVRPSGNHRGGVSGPLDRRVRMRENRCAELGVGPGLVVDWSNHLRRRVWMIEDREGRHDLPRRQPPAALRDQSPQDRKRLRIDGNPTLTEENAQSGRRNGKCRLLRL